MPAVCFYFQVHQPYRIKRYRIFDIGQDRDYFNGVDGNLNNKKVLEKVTNKCYLPANKTLLELLEKHPEFKVSFSFSGVVLEQFEEYAPEVIDSIKALLKTKRVEILSETYYHSLSYLYSEKEFKRQVAMHKRKVKSLFGVEPKIFRNTELIYNNAIAKTVEDMGYSGILAEGADHVLDWRSPDFLYRPKNTKKLSLLLKNYKLSDDIAFRFSSKCWGEYPLNAPKFASWISAKNGTGEIINLFMDYETFGEHQWEDTGIFNFLRALPGEILKHKDNSFVTPSEAVKKFRPVAELDIHNYVSWADVERDLSAWRSSPIQHDAMHKLYEMEKEVMESKNDSLIKDWRYLQTSDHFYYMCTKWFADGDVHKYFNPYDSPYEAFISYMNILQDVKLRIAEINKKKNKRQKSISRRKLIKDIK